MLKRNIALILSLSFLLSGCSSNEVEDQSINKIILTSVEETKDEPILEIPISDIQEDTETFDENIIQSTDDFNNKGLILRDIEYIETLGFSSLSDTNYLRFIEDSVYSDLITQLDSDQYYVEKVEAIYISKEYLDEVSYNSQENIYFGYNLNELNNAFEGEKYIFTLGENGQTSVELFEVYDDTYDKVIRNVAIGTGVILLCVTVSAVTAGVGTAPAVSMIFAASAKAGSIGALTGGAFNGATTFMTSYVETGDVNQAAKDSLLSASEGYMWGAICGAVAGGTAETIALKGASLNGLTMNQAAQIQKETKWDLKTISSLHSAEEADILKKANLTQLKVNDEIALVKKIDWDMVDDLGRTNRERAAQNLAPWGPDKKPYELHHIGQKTDTPLSILTYTEHHDKNNYKILHYAEEGKNITDSEWNKQRNDFWKKLLELTGG